MRKDVALACQEFAVSERRACKLLGMDRGSYRYEPRPDRNARHQALLNIGEDTSKWMSKRCAVLRELLHRNSSYGWFCGAHNSLTAVTIASGRSAGMSWPLFGTTTRLPRLDRCARRSCRSLTQICS